MLDLSSCSVPLTPEHTFICIRHCVGQCVSKCPGPVRLQTKIWSAPHLWKWTLITLYGSNFQACTCSRNLFQGGYWLSYIVNDKRTVCCGFFLMHNILRGFFCSIFRFPHKHLTYISCCLLLSDSVLMQCGGLRFTKVLSLCWLPHLHFHSFADVLYGNFLKLRI